MKSVSLRGRYAGQISAVVILAAKRADTVSRISPGVLYVGGDPVPSCRVINAAGSAAIRAHAYQAICCAITGIIRLADYSRVRMHNHERVDDDKTATWLQRIDLHAV